MRNATMRHQSNWMAAVESRVLETIPPLDNGSRPVSWPRPMESERAPALIRMLHSAGPPLNEPQP